MNKQRYVIPEGMLRAAKDAYHAQTQDGVDTMAIRESLEAAFRWLGDNPVKPSTQQIREMLGSGWSDSTCEGTMTGVMLAGLLMEWERRMFLDTARRVEETKRRL